VVVTDEIETTLERATERREERDSVLRKLEALQGQLAETQKRVNETRALLADEESDVAKLESFSPTRILATLKGSRLTDLDREHAERDAARYRVAEAEARHDVLERDEAWSSWDSFGGGGMLIDMMKYDRLDEADAALHHCNGALSVLSRELADLVVRLSQDHQRVAAEAAALTAERESLLTA